MDHKVPIDTGHREGALSRSLPGEQPVTRKAPGLAGRAPALTGRFGDQGLAIVDREPCMPTGTPARIRMTEIGTERLCERCKEWWPADQTYWYRDAAGRVLGHCRACWSERSLTESEARLMDGNR